MEAARNFVAKHTSRVGHTTEVEELVRPAVVWERIHPTRHEVVTEAIDKEVHQHHYHTTVQPLSHTETLPAKHTHNLIATKHVTHQKDNLEATKSRVAADAAQFRNISVTLPTTHTSKKMPTVIGTHYHHHIHEFVQPVIHKEVITSEVVHTTIPVHERHHSKAEHHGMSALPVKTMTEFQELQALPRSHQKYDGPPRPYESNLHTTFEQLGLAARNTAAPVTPRQQNLTLQTDSHARSSTNRTRSSSSSGSSVSSLEAPMTPTRTPRYSSKPVGNYNTLPVKTTEANRPVQIVDSGSPRMSNESTGSGRHGLMDRLTGRV